MRYGGMMLLYNGMETAWASQVTHPTRLVAKDNSTLLPGSTGSSLKTKPEPWGWKGTISPCPPDNTTASTIPKSCGLEAATRLCRHASQRKSSFGILPKNGSSQSEGTIE